MTIEISESRWQDIEAIASNIRKEDCIEAIAQGYNTIADALIESYNNSEVKFTLKVDNKPVGMFGVCKVFNMPNIWFLGTTDIDKIKKSFMVLSKGIIKEFLSEYPKLWAQVDARYTKTRRWLEWLGAVDNGAYKLNGVDFNNFVFRRA